MLRKNAPSQLKKRKCSRDRSATKRGVLSPSKQFNSNETVNGEQTTEKSEAEMSHEERIKAILAKPFKIPIPGYQGMSLFIKN